MSVGQGEDPRKSPKRCVPTLDFPYPDFFPEFYPDFGRYPKIFGPYPDSDIHLKKNFFLTFLLIKCSKISPNRRSGLHYPF